MSSISLKGSKEAALDWITVAIYLGLMLIGFSMIYAVEYRGVEGFSFSEMGPSATKQLIWIGVSMVFMTMVVSIEWKLWRTFAEVIYILSIILLVLVLFLGKEINGAKAWFSFGGALFQPAEVAKFGTCLALSNFLSAIQTDVSTLKHQAQAMGIVLLPISLILLQPDAGSALVFFSFFILLFRAGFPPLPYIAGFTIIGLFVAALLFPPLVVLGVFIGILAVILALNLRTAFRWRWAAGIVAVTIAGIATGYAPILLGVNVVTLLALFFFIWREGEPRLIGFISAFAIFGAGFAYATNYVFFNVLLRHQQERLNVWLHPELCDPKGSLYNLLQSKLAIGSGGVQGKGFLEGTMTKLNYVPEQSTDFIFCTIGEEQGFMGSLAIILLFLLLLLRITVIAERQRLPFARYYAYGVAGIIFTHVFVNIGMTMGLLPIIGIPLPFISYGGSSLIGFTLLLSVLLKLDYSRQFRGAAD